MRIWYNIPWTNEKDLGKAYNDFMRLIPNDDFACFIDRDAMFLTSFYGKQLNDIVNTYSDCGVFVAKANRIGCKWQREEGMWNENNIDVHVLKSNQLQREKYINVSDVSDIKDPLGGFLILISKKVWEEIGGFKEGLGMLGVDNELHYACKRYNKKVYLMEGVYLYHWYRGGEAKNKSHLQ